MNAMSHHALLYWADTLAAANISVNSLQEAAEVFLFEKEALNIHDVRTIIERAHRLPLEKDTQLIIISTKAILLEAQHALLKILEEPPTTTQFILVLEPGAFLLPTVLSRCQPMSSIKSVQEIPTEHTFSQFLTLSTPARITLIGEKTKKKDEAWFHQMQVGLISWLSTSPVLLKKKVYRYTVFLRQRGAAKKMLWEALSLTIPVEK